MGEEDISVDVKGVKLGWHLLAKWGWLIIAAILGGHIWMTHQSYAAMTAEQEKQNLRLDRIERAITACLNSQLDCEAHRAERIVK